jgi:hypothetical protein
MKIQFFVDVTLFCWADYVALKMKTLQSSETLGTMCTASQCQSQKTRILSYVVARTSSILMFQPSLLTQYRRQTIR